MKTIKINLSSRSEFTVSPLKSPTIEFSVAGTALTIDPAYGQYLSAGDSLVVIDGGTGGYAAGTVLNVLDYGGTGLTASTGTVDVGITGSTGTALLNNWTPLNTLGISDNATKIIENASIIEISNLYVSSDNYVLAAAVPVDYLAGVKWTQITFSLESVVDSSTGLPVSDAVVQLQYVDVTNLGGEFATLANMSTGDIFMTSGLAPEFGLSDQSSNSSGVLGIAIYNPSLSTDYNVTGTLVLAL